MFISLPILVTISVIVVVLVLALLFIIKRVKKKPHDEKFRRVTENSSKKEALLSKEEMDFIANELNNHS